MTRRINSDFARFKWVIQVARRDQSDGGDEEGRDRAITCVKTSLPAIRLLGYHARR
jgi:hypothetical protein